MASLHVAMITGHADRSLMPFDEIDVYAGEQRVCGCV
jgi:hypothetical protein